MLPNIQYVVVEHFVLVKRSWELIPGSTRINCPKNGKLTFIKFQSYNVLGFKMIFSMHNIHLHRLMQNKVGFCGVKAIRFATSGLQPRFHAVFSQIPLKNNVAGLRSKRTFSMLFQALKLASFRRESFCRNQFQVQPQIDWTNIRTQKHVVVWRRGG